MGTAKTAAHTFAGEYQAVFDAVCRAGVASGKKVVAADPTTGVITLSSSMSLASYGENLAIQVGQLGPGAIQVSIRSDLKFGLVDWGKNQKNIDELFFGIDRALSDPAAAAGMPGVAPAVTATPAATWHPDPSGRHQYRYWDGAAWSDQVSDSGLVSTDPL